MTTTTEKIAPAPWGFDGHGVNDANGQRIAKVSSCEPYTYDSGLPERNAEFDRLSHLIAAAPDLLAFAEYVADENNTLDFHTVITMARAAIRKAGGAE